MMGAYNRDLEVVAQQVYGGEPGYAPVCQAEYDAMARSFILARLGARADARTRWIGDKTPTYTRELPQLNRLFPGAKIIHIVRYPRDVAVSRMFHSKRAGATDAATAGSAQYRETLEGAARMWREAVTAVDAFAAAHPGQVCEVRYRDLHEDPIGQTSRLFGLLGAPAPRVLMQQIVAQTSFEALSGRPAGLEDPDSFLRKGVPGDWKARLDGDGARYIADYCGELMRAKRFAA